MSDEPKRVYLGAVDTTDTGGAIVLPAGLDNAPVDEIRAAIEAAEIAKREAGSGKARCCASNFSARSRSRPRLSKRRRSSGQECTRLAGAVASD